MEGGFDYELIVLGSKSVDYFKVVGNFDRNFWWFVVCVVVDISIGGNGSRNIVVGSVVYNGERVGRVDSCRSGRVCGWSDGVVRCRGVVGGVFNLDGGGSGRRSYLGGGGCGWSRGFSGWRILLGGGRRSGWGGRFDLFRGGWWWRRNLDVSGSWWGRRSNLGGGGGYISRSGSFRGGSCGRSL